LVGSRAVLDDDRAAVLVLAEDVQGQVVETGLTLDGGDLQPECLPDDVEVLHQPGCEVGGLVAPHDPRLETLEAAQPDPVDTGMTVHPTSLRSALTVLGVHLDGHSPRLSGRGPDGTPRCREPGGVRWAGVVGCCMSGPIETQAGGGRAWQSKHHDAERRGARQPGRTPVPRRHFTSNADEISHFHRYAE